MPDPPAIPRVDDDPLQHLRRSVDNHRAVTQAAVEAGQQLRTPPPPPAAPDEVQP